MSEPCAVPDCTRPRTVGRLCLVCYCIHAVLLGWPVAICAAGAAPPPARPPPDVDRWEGDGGRHG